MLNTWSNFPPPVKLSLVLRVFAPVPFPHRQKLKLTERELTILCRKWIVWDQKSKNCTLGVGDNFAWDGDYMSFLWGESLSDGHVVLLMYVLSIDGGVSKRGMGQKSWWAGREEKVLCLSYQDHHIILWWSVIISYHWMDELIREEQGAKKVDEGREREFGRIRFCASQRTESQTNSIFTGTLILKYSNTVDTSSKKRKLLFLPRSKTYHRILAFILDWFRSLQWSMIRCWGGNLLAFVLPRGLVCSHIAPFLQDNLILFIICYYLLLFVIYFVLPRGYFCSHIAPFLQHYTFSAPSNTQHRPIPTPEIQDFVNKTFEFLSKIYLIRHVEFDRCITYSLGMSTPYSKSHAQNFPHKSALKGESDECGGK